MEMEQYRCHDENNVMMEIQLQEMDVMLHVSMKCNEYVVMIY